MIDRNKYWSLFWRNEGIANLLVNPEDLYTTEPKLVTSRSSGIKSKVMLKSSSGGFSFDVALTRDMADSSAKKLIEQYREEYRKRRVTPDARL